MSRFNGIGDMLEDDVEHIHQKAAKIESRIGQMKKRSIKLLFIPDWRPYKTAGR
jgi:hypothetical protein